MDYFVFSHYENGENSSSRFYCAFYTISVNIIEENGEAVLEIKSLKTKSVFTFAEEFLFLPKKQENILSMLAEVKNKGS